MTPKTGIKLLLCLQICNFIPTTGLGIDNMAALSINDGQYKVLRVTGDEEFPRAQIHVMKKTEDGLTEDTLPVSKEYKPLKI